MRPWWAVAALAAICVGLFARQQSLEGRLRVLERATRLQGQQAGSGAEAGGAPAQSDPQAAPGLANAADAQARLRSVATEVERLREDLKSLEKATAQSATLQDLDQVAGEDRILSVVEREQNRVRDKQLEFQRDRWIEFREEAVADFTRRAQLNPDQSFAVKQALAREVDAMVSLLKRNDLMEDPELAARTWRETLDGTDLAVEDVLDERQYESWIAARQMERRVLFPWLPKD